ncbi:MAG: hypothetical protein QM599_01015 [Pseudoxanthomonas sp.]
MLSELFGVRPHELRFGAEQPSRVAEAQAAWPGIGVHERRTINAYLALPPQRRQLVGELVDALGSAPKTG